MDKKNYIIEKNVSKIINNKNTNFLSPNIIKLVLSKLKGYNPKIFKPYFDSERNIIYVKNKPKIALLEIISKENLSHREIMGSIYNLNIEDEIFGDIIIHNNHYYVFVIEKYTNLLLNCFTHVGRKHIKLAHVSSDILNDYKRKYEKINVITSSIRIDSVVSKLIHKNRDFIKSIFLKDYIYINYELCHRKNYILKNDDIFSVRKYGKYKFNGVLKNTKKGGYIIECLKYTDD